MYVGHYGASLAAKAYAKEAPLWLLFAAAQLVDIVFFPLVLLGVEQFNVVPDYTASTHFQLPYMPYTHSLAAAAAWSAAAFAVVFLWPWRYPVRRQAVALAVALCVFSHWVLDLIVHTPDLPLAGDGTPKLGFGLWHSAGGTWLLEAALLLGGLWLYLRSSLPRVRAGRYAMGVFVAVLLLVNAGNVFGPAPPVGATAVAVAAFASYLAFAAVAGLLERLRAARA